MKRNIILMSGIIIMIVLVLFSCNSFRNKHIYVQNPVKKVSVDKAYMGAHLTTFGTYPLHVYIFYVNTDTNEIYTILGVNEIKLKTSGNATQKIPTPITEIPAGTYRFLAVSFFDILNQQVSSYSSSNKKVTTYFFRDTVAGISNPSVDEMSFPKEFQVNNGEIAYIGAFNITEVDKKKQTISMRYVEAPEKINAYISQSVKNASLMKIRDLHAEQSIQE